MIVLHNVLKISVHGLERVIVPDFLIRFYRSGVWYCFSVVESYCADIPEAKTLCTVKHGLIVPRTCHRCLCTPEDFEKITKSNIRHTFHTSFTRGEVQKLRKKIDFESIRERFTKLVYIRRKLKII